MPRIVAERRDRRIMFRVSHEEHERLRRICVATRTSSVSELVRRAVVHEVVEIIPSLLTR
jgi:hypothetical protein